MGSQPGGGHETPVVDWVAVYIMLAGTCLLGLALPFTSWWLGIAGGVVLAVGAAVALAYGVMNHTEDYEMQPRIVESDPTSAESGHAQRIISA